MYKLLCPDRIVIGLQDIDFQEIKRRGIQGIIFDLDNTLIPWDSSELSEEVLLWMEDLLKSGFKAGLVSNNREKRVSEIAGRFGIPYVCRAYKPSKYGFNRIAAAMKLSPEVVAVVGDQLFTDVLGGNRLGMFTIWVKPLSSREFIGTKVTRQLEKMMVRILRAKKLIR